MKLEAAAGLVCIRDTPSLSISFPYAGADGGWTGSSLSARAPSLLLFMLPPSLSATLQLIKWGGGGVKSVRLGFLGKGILRLVRKHLMFVAAAQQGKSLLWRAGLATHTDTHAVNIITEYMHTFMSGMQRS